MQKLSEATSWYKVFENNSVELNVVLACTDCDESETRRMARASQSESQKRAKKLPLNTHDAEKAEDSSTPRKEKLSKLATPPNRFPIVGMGASAGGLEAFQDLLKHLPADTGMGFVLVQHLDPQHESALTQLLARATTMPVYEVTQNLRVEPNSIYVIPPNVLMAIVDGALKLTPRSNERGATRSIDFFFEALAHDQREQAIGVVLSGTASDGTIGLEAIKAEGGVTFAQDESAKYDSMPRSAIAAGCVDLVLAPEQIAAELARIAKHPFVMNAPSGEAAVIQSEAEREADQHEGTDEPLASGGHGTPRTDSQLAKSEAEVAGDTPANLTHFIPMCSSASQAFFVTPRRLTRSNAKSFPNFSRSASATNRSAFGLDYVSKSADLSRTRVAEENLSCVPFCLEARRFPFPRCRRVDRRTLKSVGCKFSVDCEKSMEHCDGFIQRN